MKADRFRFRAWDKKNKRFALDSGKMAFHLIGETTMFDLLNQYRIEEYDDLVIMQSTGLLSKGGKEIFEGDIIQGNPIGDGKPWFIVRFGLFIDDTTGLGIESAFFGEKVGDSSVTTACISWHSGEIIGNIYEDSHLLDKEAT